MKDKTKAGAGTSARKNDWLGGVLLFAVLIFIDQLTKALADAYQPQFDIIKGWLGITIVYNPGISFGLASDLSVGAKLAIVIGTAVIMAALSVAWFFVNRERRLVRTALVFIVAGGVGNLIDRVYYRVWELDNAEAALLHRGVRDMVDVSRFGFAVCNFADFFITAGAIMLVLSFLFFDAEAFFPVGKYKEMRDRQKQAEEEREKRKKAAETTGTEPTKPEPQQDGTEKDG